MQSASKFLVQTVVLMRYIIDTMLALQDSPQSSGLPRLVQTLASKAELKRAFKKHAIPLMAYLVRVKSLRRQLQTHVQL